MARTKQTSRNSSRKRYSIAVVSGSKENKRLKTNAEKKMKIPEAKTAVEEKEVDPIMEPIIPSKVTSHAWAYIYFCGVDNSCKEGLTDEMSGLSPFAGKWLLFNDEDVCSTAGMSHHDYAWTIAKSLVKDFINTGIIAAKCSTAAVSQDSHYAQAVVCCYTEHYSNIQTVKRAAEAIRSAYPYPLSMYYKAERDSYCAVYNLQGDRLVTKYKHTIDNKFYERNIKNGYRWQLLEFCEDIAINETTMPSRVSSHQWLSISFNQDSNNITVCAFDYLENNSENAGEWLLFNNSNSVCPFQGMSHHDFAWNALRPLVYDHLNSGITTIKSSTKAMNEFLPGSGVICCYTENYNDKESVKKAAEAIRKAYSYPNAMFYKREKDSEMGLYSVEGDRAYTIYKHMPDNQMFERCQDDSEWKLVEL